MKTFTQQLAGSIGILLCASITSCVDPYAYDSYGPVTTYRSGYEVRTLPPGYRTEIIDGNRYYVYGNTYYRPRSGRYVVVDPPRYVDRRRDEDRRYDDRRYDNRRTVVVRELPYGYRTETHRGVRYYRANDVYYRPSGSGYIIVERPY